MSQKQNIKLYNSLTNVSDEYIEEAVNAVLDKAIVKRKKIRYLVPLAACLILVFSAFTVLAKTSWGTRIIDMFTSRTESGPCYSESGYDLSVDIKKVPISQLQGDVRQVSEIIAEQFDNYEPWDSWYPGSWYKEFPSSAEAIAFVGLKSLESLDWNLKELNTSLSVTGNAEGELQSLDIETDYKVEDIRLQAYSRIYTENYTDEIIFGIRTTEDISFTEAYYTTDNGLQCHIVTSTALESGYLSKEGYVVKNGVLYSLHIAYLEKDAKQAEELMCQWAELF
ncbi:MAG: hypothetical protein IJ439_03045 [Tyzzerella sp.]|nr:hypothetical protein [Tyzzerella sp.]